MAVPQCSLFGSCGGCSAQHIDYALQLENKKNLVISELRRCGLNVPKEVPVFSANQYYYRNRMDFVVGPQGIGLRRQGRSDEILLVNDCPISNKKINQLLKEVNLWYGKNKQEISSFHPKRQSGVLKYIVIRASEHTDDSTLSFVLNEDDPAYGSHIEMVKEFSTICSAKNVVIAALAKNKDMSTSAECFEVKGSTYMEEKLHDTTIRFSSQGFFQNNTKLAELMISFCRKILAKEQTKNMILIDLYGGAGTFGLSLADLFSETVIIDREEINIDCANQNIAANNIHRVVAQTRDASSFKAEHYDKETVLITDPPRTGMHQKTIQNVNDLNPCLFIYVSCNPAQMTRELLRFPNYTIVQLGIFDLFPQTPHVEAIAVLKRKENN